MCVQHCGAALPLAFHFGIHVNWSERSHWMPEMCFVVSGLSLSNVLVYGLKIKEFCGGMAGWNDREIFIETDIKCGHAQCSQILTKFCLKLCPLL